MAKGGHDKALEANPPVEGDDNRRNDESDSDDGLRLKLGLGLVIFLYRSGHHAN